MPSKMWFLSKGIILVVPQEHGNSRLALGEICDVDDVLEDIRNSSLVQAFPFFPETTAEP